MKIISASEANRQFSSLLRQVQGGETVAILSRGRTVAVMSPSTMEGEKQSRARERLLIRLKTQKVSDVGAWSRDDLYDA